MSPRGPWRRRLWVVPLLLAAVAGLYLERLSRVDPRELAAAPGPLVVDRQGQVLRLVPDAQGQRGINLPAGELPPLVAAAFVAAEDQRFWQHPGVDLFAVIRAAGQNLLARRVVSGASTLTQQLARLVYPGPRTLWAKVVEMVRSLRLEGMLSKEEILRHYLNRVPLGGTIVGVEAAARAYFGKPAAHLTPGEAALLASLAKAPSALRPQGPKRERLLARQRWVLGRMAALGYLAPEDLAAALAQPPEFPGALGAAAGFPFRAPHFVNLVLSQEGPEAAVKGRLETTLDLSLQRRVEGIMRSHRANLHKGGASQAAAVVLDNRTMGVVALVGSLAYGPRDQGFNNGAAALRSPGSALKPFLYAQALDQGFSAGLVLEDVERRYRTPRGEFNPANFDRSAHGPVPFREALGNSLNLSAVYLLNAAGPEAYFDTLKRLNLINHPQLGPEHYGLGLVVGNPEVTLLQLAAAYAALANQGIYRPPRLLARTPPDPGVPVFSPQAAYLISDMLSDPMARGRTFSGSQAMNPLMRLAIKTGTSTRYRDCWCVMYSPEYTIAVWVGNFSGRPTATLSGAAAAAPIAADLARELYDGRPPAPFPRPEGIVDATVCAFSGLKPGPGCTHRRQELFIQGTEPTQVCAFHHPREPWHRMPTPYAGWLHDRHGKGGEGRFRLAGFPQDLDRVFTPAPPPPPATRLTPGTRITLGHPGSFAPPLPPDPRQPPLVTIEAPLTGSRFLLPPGEQALRLRLRAGCRTPLPAVTWFVNGREEAVVGPPYELTLELPRGRHRLTAAGPDHTGEVVEVTVE
jgi:penicillin-binding protein 1C